MSAQEQHQTQDQPHHAQLSSTRCQAIVAALEQEQEQERPCADNAATAEP
jgi:hypothetical protein